jgi:hypothetical protein
MTDTFDSSPAASLPVIACELTALTESERLRRETLAKSLLALVTEVKDLPAGYEFHLERHPATERQVDELIALERVCCPFLTLASRVDGETGRLVLEMAGGPGVRAFIAAQFGAQGALIPKESP